MLHAYSKKSQENFSLCTNFEIFQKFSVKIKIFLHILIVPIMYECGKLKKAIGNKILFPVILEQCDKLSCSSEVMLVCIVYLKHIGGNVLKI